MHSPPVYAIKVNHTKSRIDDLSKYSIALSQRPAILIPVPFEKYYEPSIENMWTEHFEGKDVDLYVLYLKMCSAV